MPNILDSEARLHIIFTPGSRSSNGNIASFMYEGKEAGKPLTGS